MSATSRFMVSIVGFPAYVILSLSVDGRVVHLFVPAGDKGAFAHYPIYATEFLGAIRKKSE